jgi:glycosyltransferase A (GT-A) superfamily protein (DUF2064 family)
MMRIKVATFVKTPGISPLKTRLAQSSTRAIADQFYQLSVQAMDEWMEFQRRAGAQCFWAVAEDPCIVGSHWRSHPMLAQGSGDLGHRLAAVYQTLTEDRGSVGVLIGADAPQLPRGLLTNIGDLLGRGNDVVVGPSRDGGFYLFASALQLGATCWQNVEYSTPSTLRDLLQQSALRSGRVAFLPELQDVDEFADLRGIELELAALGAQRLPAQTAILRWIEAELDVSKKALQK